MHLDEVDGDEKAHEEEKTRDCYENKLDVLERFQKDLYVEWPGLGRQPRLDCGERDEHEAEDHETKSAHRPCIANFWDQVGRHNWHDYTTQPTAGSHYSEGQASFLEKPRGDRARARLEDAVET